MRISGIFTSCTLIDENISPMVCPPVHLFERGTRKIIVVLCPKKELPPPPPRTPRENRMTPMDPQKGGKTSSLAAAKRGRGKRPKRRWGKIVFHVDTKVFHV